MCLSGEQLPVPVLPLLSTGDQTSTWTGKRWRDGPSLTSRSECVALRWSWTASLENTGSEQVQNPGQTRSHSPGFRSLFVCLFVDGEGGHGDGHRQKPEPLGGHRPGVMSIKPSSLKEQYVQIFVAAG